MHLLGLPFVPFLLKLSAGNEYERVGSSCAYAYSYVARVLTCRLSGVCAYAYFLERSRLIQSFSLPVKLPLKRS